MKINLERVLDRQITELHYQVMFNNYAIMNVGFVGAQYPLRYIGEMLLTFNRAPPLTTVEQLDDSNFVREITASIEAVLGRRQNISENCVKAMQRKRYIAMLA
jgi:hypothetical protein